MSEPCVTIGIPVYNAEDMIAECLDCLLNQTYRNIRVVISDNASTDGTQGIVEQYAAIDDRITYLRRPENVGPVRNFRGLVDAAQTPLFLWRAHDDLSSADYVERLVAAFDRTPDALLAVPTVMTYRNDRPVTIARPREPQGTQLRQIADLLYNSHASWFYGMWRTDALRGILDYVNRAYPDPWGSDHLVMYPVFIRRAVAMAPEAQFSQRVIWKEANRSMRIVPAMHLIRLRRAYWRACLHDIDEAGFSGAKKLGLKGITFFYVGKRVARVGKIIRVAIRQVLALFKHGTKK